jgi:DNA/RNA-binding domain of Phe-tRNA-synthetase-like protein
MVRMETGRGRRFSVAPELFELVPDYRRAVVAGPRKRAPDIAAIALGLRQANAMRRDEQGAVTDIPAVARWRRAYRAVGLDPTKTRPAVEALIRRARSDGVSSLGIAPIDAGTIVTLMAAVPVGVHVLDEIADGLTLDFAKGNERFVSLQGEREQPLAGEPVWRAGETILTRRWVHKQGALGSVDAASTLFAVNLDLLEGDDLDAVVELSRGWLASAGIDADATVVLSRERPTGTIALPRVADA